ncbi:glycosyltransferase [Dokdonia sp. Hel_I_53]|uniref:glycosyltransferase n=1 Tax=Dokdonia sp. Hel_I_53 TaxID=1566287 RepID=UPI00119A22CD|nr:glycosyltransferase [Dokdonia sp. Hel_I_53]TVZ53433.1 glycosyl transferase family 1 [Dokdonia sp. Hel_I_53]
MRILLIGEYSRLHNSLKEGLLGLGHQVTIVGSGDGFKNYPVDITLKLGFQKGLKKKLRLAILKLTTIDIAAVDLRGKFQKHKSKLSGYDVVQLINESSFQTTPELELETAKFLKEHNKKLFLLSCGTDHISVTHAFSNELLYTIATPYKEGKIEENSFYPTLKYLKPEYKKLSEELYELIDGVISTDMDYHLPLVNHPKYLGLIPNPINVDILPYKSLNITGEIRIFHGINRTNYFKKGNDLFEAALDIIQKKYPNKVSVITVESLPYTEYIKTYNDSHILLDQIYSHDQGYNALEAMAKGKVVFTGAGKHFLKYHNLDHTVAIDATPSVEDLVKSLETLIEHPEKLDNISKNARAFIEEQHNYITIAQQYLDVWNNN